MLRVVVSWVYLLADRGGFARAHETSYGMWQLPRPETIILHMRNGIQLRNGLNTLHSSLPKQQVITNAKLRSDTITIN